MAEEKRVISLALKKITLDPRTQPREKMDQTVILDYAELVDVLPPVVVFGNNGVAWWLADGWHRYYAHQEAGRKHILADVRAGGVRDAILFSCGVNSQHGLRRTNEDKRRAVRTLLLDPEWGKWSNREIARQCAVDEGTVRNYREQLKEEKTAEVPHTEGRRLVQIGGTTYERPDAGPLITEHRVPCPHCRGTGWLP